MGGFVDALGKGFERILRWLYPGALFLILLFLSYQDSYDELMYIFPIFEVWGLVVIAVVAGMVIYLTHMYFINQIISLLFACFGLLHRCNEQLKNLKWLTNIVDAWSAPAWRRWGLRTQDLSDHQARERLNNWMDYSWGTYHAGCMTLELTIFFLFFHDGDSNIAKFVDWLGVWGCIVLGIFLFLFLLSLLLQYLVLTRLTLRLPKYS